MKRLAALALLLALGAAPRASAAQTVALPAEPAPIFAHVLLNQFEARAGGASAAFRWDGEAWLGTDFNRLWLKSEGFAQAGTLRDADVEAFYDRPLPRLRYFDAQIGVREDFGSGPSRTWLAVGLEGLAPGFVQFEPTFYVRSGGHWAARLAASKDVLMTQRLILQPELELNFYSRADPQRGLGAGLSDLDAGLRLRYEFSRKFAPYLGFAYTRDYGGTAAFDRPVGRAIAAPRLTLGVRYWF
jgi:copper resistance protein B